MIVPLASSDFSHNIFFFYQYSNKYNIDCFQIYNNMQVIYDFRSAQHNGCNTKMPHGRRRRWQKSASYQENVICSQSLCQESKYTKYRLPVLIGNKMFKIWGSLCFLRSRQALYSRSNWKMANPNRSLCRSVLLPRIWRMPEKCVRRVTN
jgi:hypothetical protein